MVAPTILLNSGAAFGTFLGVGIDPVGSFRIIFTLLDPHLDQGTRRRLMIIKGASKTEAMFTCTYHGRYYFAKVLLLDAAVNGIFTIRCRAPFKMLLVVNICSSKENSISRYKVSIKSITGQKKPTLI